MLQFLKKYNNSDKITKMPNILLHYIIYNKTLDYGQSKKLNFPGQVSIKKIIAVQWYKLIFVSN